MTALRSAILLDRDGTIIVERDYLSDPAQVTLERGAAVGLRALAAAGHALVVLSNQSGIGRGYFDDAALAAVNARLAELLAAEGIAIAGWYHCPHAPEADCACRKPRPGMALAAAADLGLDLTRSVMIGDKRSDLLMADAVGARGILVATGHAGDDMAWAAATGRTVAADLGEVAGIILSAAGIRED